MSKRAESQTDSEAAGAQQDEAAPAQPVPVQVTLDGETYERIRQAGHEMAAFIVCAIREKLDGPQQTPPPTVLPDHHARFLCAVLTDQRNRALDESARAQTATLMLRAGVQQEHPGGAV